MRDISLPRVDDDVDEVSADELLTATIPSARKGYDRDAVDDLLERAAATIERLATLDGPDQERRRRERADQLQRTLMVAQASADATRRDARVAAASVLEDADERAERVVAEAQDAAGHLVETQRAAVERLLRVALEERQAVERDIAELEGFAAQLRARLQAVLCEEARALDELTRDLAAGRPAGDDIDLTRPGIDPPAVPDGTEEPSDEVTWSASTEPLMAVVVGDAGA